MTVINPRTRRVPSFGVEVVLVAAAAGLLLLGLLTLLQLSLLVHQSIMAQHLAEQ
jgi:hypothetical protein